MERGASPFIDAAAEIRNAAKIIDIQRAIWICSKKIFEPEGSKVFGLPVFLVLLGQLKATHWPINGAH